MENKKSRKSASKWTRASEGCLISIWKEKLIQLRGCRKNSHVVAEMVAEMEKQGFAYTGSEVKSKMHNLTVRYRNEKKCIGVSGGSPSQWDLYNDLHCLLGPYKSVNTENLVMDSINDIDSNITDPPSTSAASSTSASDIATNASSSSSWAISTSMPSTETASSLASSMETPSSSKRKKNDSLLAVIKKVEENIANVHDEMQKTSQKLIEIEEGKKKILEEFVNREAEVQKALIEFLRTTSP